MSKFSVFTIDGRATQFNEGNGSSADVFLVQWKNAVRDPDGLWPFAYMTVDGKDEVVHFNPLTITAVVVDVKDPRRSPRRGQGRRSASPPPHPQFHGGP